MAWHASCVSGQKSAALSLVPSRVPCFMHDVRHDLVLREGWWNQELLEPVGSRGVPGAAVGQHAGACWLVNVCMPVWLKHWACSKLAAAHGHQVAGQG